MNNHHRSILVIGVLLAMSPTNAATVEITGGFDSGQNAFSWTIANHDSSPIVYVEFPHYHAESLDVPDGWTAKGTNLVGAKTPADAGVCTATVDNPARAIRPGDSKVFGMPFTRSKPDVGKGNVRVRLADGREWVVAGVELPVRLPEGFGAAPPIVLGMAFVAYVLWRSLRGGKKATTPPSTREEVI